MTHLTRDVLPISQSPTTTSFPLNKLCPGSATGGWTATGGENGSSSGQTGGRGSDVDVAAGPGEPTVRLGGYNRIGDRKLDVAAASSGQPPGGLGDEFENAAGPGMGVRTVALVLATTRLNGNLDVEEMRRVPWALASLSSPPSQKSRWS